MLFLYFRFVIEASVLVRGAGKFIDTEKLLTSAHVLCYYFSKNKQ